jgi:hypothetical protein
VVVIVGRAFGGQAGELASNERPSEALVLLNRIADASHPNRCSCRADASFKFLVASRSADPPMTVERE